MKKNRTYGLMENICLLKMLKIMRFTIFILFLSLSQAFAVDSYSQQTKLSLDLKNAKVEDVLDKIEKSSEFFFMYNKGMVDVERKIDIQVKEKGINQILDKVFENTSISYSITNRQILLINNGILSNGAETISQQQKSVSGKVTDSSGGSLPGVSVVVKGTTIGTITDSDGKYSLSKVPADATLQFSFVGMKSQEILVGENTSINAMLTEDTIGIEEVVTVGYGTQKRVNLTGSLSSVGGDDLKTSKNTDLTNMMAGKLAGLRVKQQNSEPGQYNTHFDIRGWDSPLIIVDGVERPKWNRMNANEIESINILKDASAAIYGVKAANGVILITTKSGKKGQSNIEYTGSYGLKAMTEFPKTLNLYEFATLTNENSVNLGNPPGYSKELIQKFKDGTVKGQDWQEPVMRDFSPQHEHSLTLSGGSDKVTYFVNGAYLYDEGLWKTGDLNYARYNLRSNLVAEITDNITASLQVSGVSDIKQRPSGGRGTETIIRSIFFQQPTLSLYANNNPEYLSVVYDGTHPLALTNKEISGYDRNYNKVFNTNFSLDYDVPFLDGLKAKMMFAYDYDENYNKNWRKKFKLYEYNAQNETYTSKYTDAPSQLRESRQASSKTTIQASLNYEKTFAEKHNVKVLGLFEQIQYDINNFYGQREFPMDGLDQLYAGSSINQQAYSDPNQIYELANQGFVGRLNYDYKGNYLAEFGFRYDGSSKFAEGAQWGFFPYASLGWRISEESFMDFFKPLDDLKIRASIGVLGDDAASRYQFLTGYTYPSSGDVFGGNYNLGSGYVFGGDYKSGLGFLGMPNPNITWFTAQTTNIGIDGSLWSRGLYFTVDAFRRYRDGLLATRLLSLPTTVGANLPQENLESDLTKGYEIVLGHKNNINDFNYDVSVNFAYTRTKWVDREQPQAGNSFLNWRSNGEDRFKNIWWGGNQIGQFNSQEEIFNSAVQDGMGNRDLLPGDLKYEDFNEDGIIDDLDRKPIGYGTIPEINYGINISMAWKGFDLDLLFHGSSNFNRRNYEFLNYPLPWGQNGLAMFMDRWHRSDQFDPTSEWIPGKYPSTRNPTSVPWNYWDSNFWVEDATFLRLKSVELGYSLPAHWMNRIGVNNIRVFASGHNVFLLSKALSGIDPEVPGSGSPYPMFKNFNFGITVKL